MRVSSLFYLLLVLAPPCSVAEEKVSPSMALLEYLGEWQDEDGNTVDPQALVLLQLDNLAGEGESDDKE